MSSVFAKYTEQGFKYRYAGTLQMATIAGGVPLNPAVLEGHLKRKVAAPDDLIRADIAEIMVEQGIEGSVEEAVEELARLKGLVGFRSDPEHGLWVAGANLKACMKEAVSIAAAADKIKAKGWGVTSSRKGIQSFVAEHVFVVDDRLYLGVSEPTEIPQSFIHKITPKGPVNAIQYTEIVENCEINFTVEADWEFSDADWAAIWTTAERNGFGASRSRGYGRFEVTRWDRIPVGTPEVLAQGNGAPELVGTTV